MAFKIAYMETGSAPAYTKLAIKSGQTYSAGTLLKFGSTGPLEVCGASDNPLYVLMENVTSTVAGQQVIVQPISEFAVYETTAAAPIPSTLIGSTLQTSSGTAVTTTAVVGTKTGAYGATFVSPNVNLVTGDTMFVKFTKIPVLSAT